MLHGHRTVMLSVEHVENVRGSCMCVLLPSVHWDERIWQVSAVLCREGRIDLGCFIELKFLLQSETRGRRIGQEHFHELPAPLYTVTTLIIVVPIVEGCSSCIESICRTTCSVSVSSNKYSNSEKVVMKKVSHYSRWVRMITHCHHLIYFWEFNLPISSLQFNSNIWAFCSLFRAKHITLLTFDMCKPIENILFLRYIFLRHIC